jgi:hypothetical protein
MGDKKIDEILNWQNTKEWFSFTSSSFVHQPPLGGCLFRGNGATIWFHP